MAAKTTPEAPPAPKEPSQAPNGQAPDAPQTPPTAAAPAGQQDGQAPGDPAVLPPESEKGRYEVTGRSDVLHNGALYIAGEHLSLDPEQAYSLLKNGYIKPKDGIQ